MSVLACNRRGCDNFMCDHYSYHYGYICRNCLQELMDNGPTNIEVFMGTTKDKHYSQDELDEWCGKLRNIFKWS